MYVGNIISLNELLSAQIKKQLECTWDARSSATAFTYEDHN